MRQGSDGGMASADLIMAKISSHKISKGSVSLSGMSSKVAVK